MATLVSFWSLFGNRMADLGLIDSKLGLYIKINVNSGQNKFEVHISKNVAKMAILWPKIGQRHFGTRASHGHNLAIFHQILTNEHTKMTSSLRRIEWNTILSSIFLFYILVFWPHFCSETSHGQCCTYGLKTTLKLLVHVLAIMASSYLKIVFQQKSGLNPPPPPPPPPPLRSRKELYLVIKKQLNTFKTCCELDLMIIKSKETPVKKGLANQYFIIKNVYHECTQPIYVYHCSNETLKTMKYRTPIGSPDGDPNYRYSICL